MVPITTCTPASRHARAFASAWSGTREVDDDVGVAEHVGERDVRAPDRPARVSDEVVGALDGGAHRLAHPPRGAGDGDPRHAARGSAAGQTPATASVKAASSGPMPAAESASGAHSSSTSALRSARLTASMRAMISSISSSGSP